MNRYQRITQLGWKRNVLQNTKVLVVGAGALGNEVLKNLALLGVGHIIIVDMDRIEDHNLTRSVLFRQSDIGEYKASVAARCVQEIDENIRVQAFTQAVQDVCGLGIYQMVDVVFGCLDNIQARIDINRYCYQTNTPLIDAGLRHLDGDVKVLGNGFDVCLDCTFTDALRQAAWRRFSCLKLRVKQETATLPTAPTIASIMAGFQVQIAMKYLHGKNVPFNKRISVLGNIDDLNVSRLSPNPICPTHNLYDSIINQKIKTIPYDSQTLTVKHFIDWVKKEDGPTACIQLDYDLITELLCKTHLYSRKIYRKRGSLYIDEAECPMCLAEGKTSIAALMSEQVTNQLDGSEDAALLQKTLTEIGTPFYQIFAVKSMEAHKLRTTYYLIAGDAIFFDFC